VFGTLLGAVREHDFIVHDKDTDVALFGSECTFIHKLDALMRELGFVTTRNWPGLISWERNKEYIDCYQFHEVPCDEQVMITAYECRITDNHGTVTGHFKMPLSEVQGDTIQFHGATFGSPRAVPYLRRVYGANWKTPIKDKHAPHFT